MAAVLALVAALAYGAADFYGGLATRRLPAATVVLRSNTLAFPCLLTANLMVSGTWTGHDAAVGTLAGVAATAGLLLLFRALAEGTMSIVAPITAVLAAVVPMTVGVATGERPAPLAVTGLPVALVAVVLLAAPPTAGGGRAHVPASNLLAALCAGLAFGLFFVALDATSDDAGLWPVVVSQAASIVLLTTVKLFGGSGGGAARNAASQQWAAVVASGLFSAVGHVSFLLATQRGLLTLVAVIASLYPASTLLLARLVLGERITGLQRFGAVLAGVAVVLVSLP
ncbi:MAG: EamA family transporter [Acidimicrobiia bacterium]